MQGQLKAILLCLRYVDSVAFGAWFVPSWCTKKQVQKQNFVVVFLGGHMASRADTALTVSLQEENLLSSHVHLAVGTPQCHD